MQPISWPMAYYNIAFPTTNRSWWWFFLFKFHFGRRSIVCYNKKPSNTDVRISNVKRQTVSLQHFSVGAETINFARGEACLQHSKQSYRLDT